MAKLNLETQTTKLGVTVQESDEYTQLVQVRFDKHVLPEDTETSHVMFLTAHQLETIAKFMLEEAGKIRNIQEAR